MKILQDIMTKYVYIRFSFIARWDFTVLKFAIMITWVVFLRTFWNFISSLPVKRGGSLSFLVGTISNVLVMEIGWTGYLHIIYIMLYRVHLAWVGLELTMLVARRTDCIGSCNSNFHVKIEEIVFKPLL
jgi:hypothetical protein